MESLKLNNIEFFSHKNTCAGYYPFGKLINELSYNPNSFFTSTYQNKEFLEKLGLHDFHARYYDSELGRWFNVDPALQMFSPYSAMGNNPVIYVDPDGEFFGTIFTFVIDFIVTGFFEGGFDITSSKHMREAWRDFDPTRSGSKTNNAWKIDCGLFNTDPNRSFGERLLQLVSRFTWELPQTLTGNIYSHTRNNFRTVDRVDYFGGATFLTSENNKTQDGISLGNYINVNINDEIEGKFEDRVISDPLYMHEYGHTFDSFRYGPLYLFYPGIPSLISAATSERVIGQNYSTHSEKWYERSANKHAAWYLKKYYGIDWEDIDDENKYPR